MNLISRLFSNSKSECPRCLGKGRVDTADIKRLDKERVWIPGECAYCLGKGEVDARLISKVPADMTYLSLDLPTLERNRLFSGDKAAHERAANFEAKTNVFIDQVRYLHIDAGMDAISIAKFYRIADDRLREDDEEMQKFIEFVEGVVNSHNRLD